MTGRSPQITSHRTENIAQDTSATSIPSLPDPGPSLSEVRTTAKIQDKTREAFAHLYRESERESFVDITPPLEISDCFIAHGTTSTCFPLPGGGTIESNVSIGICKGTTSIYLTRIERFQDEGHLLTIDYQTPRGKIRTVKVCAYASYDGDTAIHPLWRHQARELRSLYKKTYTEGKVDANPEIDISDLFLPNQLIRTSFPLPDGTTIGKSYLVGVSKFTEKVRVSRAEYDSMKKLFTLTLHCDQKETSYEHKLYYKIKTGSTLQTKKEIQDEQLHELFQRCEREGITIPDPPFSIAGYMNSIGTVLHQTFPHPDGSHIGARVSPGFFNGARGHKIVKLEKIDYAGILCTVVARSGKGKSTEVSFLLRTGMYSTEGGKISTHQRWQREQLLTLYDMALLSEDPLYPNIDISSLFTTSGTTRLSFPLFNGNDIGVMFCPGFFHDLKTVILHGIRRTQEGDLLLKLHGTSATGREGSTVIKVPTDSDGERPIELYR